MTKQQKVRKGFTIVEVTIVTAFVAMLLIAITALITQTTAIYQKGLTLKAIDAVGRNLVVEFTTAINAAPSVDATSLCNMFLSNDGARQDCLEDNAFNYVYQSYGDDHYVDPITKSEGPVQYYGVLCTGDYSYVWNTYYGQNGGSTVSVDYNYKTGATTHNETKNDFKLTRFKDTAYLACSNNVNQNYQVTDNFKLNHKINMRATANGNFNEMTDDSFQGGFLDASNVTLALYELTLFPISQDAVTLRSFFAGTFILATERGDVSIVRSGDYCNPNDTTDGAMGGTLNLGSNFSYCGINKFNFAARTAGNKV